MNLLKKFKTKHCNIFNNFRKYSFSIGKNKEEGAVRDESKTLFLSSSNIDRNKNIHHVITLFLKLELNAELHLYGRIIDEFYFDTVIEPLLLEAKGRIKYLGVCSHRKLIHRLPRYSFVFQLSAKMEGNSMSIIEAMVQGNVIPIVSNVGGLPEIVGHGRYGKFKYF